MGNKKKIGKASGTQVYAIPVADASHTLIHYRSLLLGVTLNNAVAEANDSVGIGCDFFFVCDQNHGVASGVNVAKKFHDFN